MACWTVPLIATLLTYIGRHTSHSKDIHGFWLNIMLLGGTVFGVIDHLWYGELFIIGANWAMDLALGGAITAGITACCGAITFKTRITDLMRNLGCRAGILRN